ncbi:MAG: STAS/SEC14 domain-containing protein [bacterium]|nr:STAS/SEC14 domain-containing protein [bacterium]
MGDSQSVWELLQPGVERRGEASAARASNAAECDATPEILTSVYPARKLTIHAVRGTVSFDDIVAVIIEFFQGDPTLHVLWDLRHATTANLTLQHVWGLVRTAMTQGKARRGGRTAVVASGPVEYGLSRMFQALTEVELAPFKVRVFKDLEDALRWLGEDL